MFSLNLVSLAVGFGVGMCLATACLVFASLYDDCVEEQKWLKGQGSKK